MQFEATLKKMTTEIGDPIQYYMIFDDNFIHVNQLLGKEIAIDLIGSQCLNCNKSKKVFRQGFCYDCFYKSPAVGDWIMRPELSTAHLGIADRDLEYETLVQITPHIIYLASSCEVKVGVTRGTQVPTRWIDQGASAAIPIMEVPNRYLAGITEVALKDHFVDKTNWRKMLLNEVVCVDLEEARSKVKDLIPDEAKEYFDLKPQVAVNLSYPVLQYPTKIKSLSLEKIPNFKGILTGIKGQYLMFEDGTVFNVRSAEGSVVRISV